jgi:hypothetical protein
MLNGTCLTNFQNSFILSSPSFSKRALTSTPKSVAMLRSSSLALLVERQFTARETCPMLRSVGVARSRYNCEARLRQTTHMLEGMDEWTESFKVKRESESSNMRLDARVPS